MEKLDLSKDNLRKFSLTMSAAFLVITLFVFFRHHRLPLFVYLTSAIFIILAFTLTGLLRPIYIFWMHLAFILSWLNTRLILFIIFYLVLTPIGLVMKLFRADLLDLKIEKGRGSYWGKKEKQSFSPLGYERQF